MGTIGDAYDNAVIESFWARMQTELLDRHRWKTRVELANANFEYLEVFYNRQRRHSALGWRHPRLSTRSCTQSTPPNSDTPGSPNGAHIKSRLCLPGLLPGRGRLWWSSLQGPEDRFAGLGKASR